jgi:hypothetical protein
VRTTFLLYFTVLIQESQHPGAQSGISQSSAMTYFIVPFQQSVAQKQHFLKKMVLVRDNRTSLCCSVAVLQFQNRFYESQKLTLYLYINIEVFLGYGNTL